MSVETPATNVHDVMSEASDEVLSTFFEESSTPETLEQEVSSETKDTPEDEGALETEETAQPAVEGYVNVPSVTDGLATDFILRDATGELEVPALTIEYKANGRVRRDRLDQVVKMAQYGVYNVEREQQLRAREEQVDAGSDEVRSTLELREIQLSNLLSDPDLYEQARDRYLESSAPEQQVVRLQARLDEQENESRRGQTSAAAMSFTQDQIVPALETIAAALPEVSVNELSQELAVGLYPFMVNGVVPAARYGEVRRYIVEHLTEWARETHDHRVRRFSSVRERADGEVQKARVQAQRAKSTVARATKPVGRIAPDRATKPALRVNPSLDEASESALADIMATVRSFG